MVTAVVTGGGCVIGGATGKAESSVLLLRQALEVDPHHAATLLRYGIWHVESVPCSLFTLCAVF